MNRIGHMVLGLGILGLLLLGATACRPVASSASPAATSAAEPPGAALQWTAPPSMQIDPAKSYEAVFTTERGEFRVHLFADKAPVTVNNFVFLARQGFYDNTTFHRVLPGFMAQGGDPTGKGTGGPGYAFEDEFDPELGFDRPGLLAMANRGPNTNGSQFFITYGPTPHLDGLHTIFGEIVEGAEVLESLTPRDPMQNPDFEGDALVSVEILETDG